MNMIRAAARDRQWRAEPGQQYPPRLHRHDHRREHAEQSRGDRGEAKVTQGGANTGPLAGHRVAAEADRDRHEAPADRPAGAAGRRGPSGSAARPYLPGGSLLRSPAGGAT